MLEAATSEAAVEVFFPTSVASARFPAFVAALTQANPGATVRCAHHEISEPEENRHALGIVSGMLDVERACTDNARLVFRLLEERIMVVFTNPAATKRCELCGT